MPPFTEDPPEILEVIPKKDYNELWESNKGLTPMPLRFRKELPPLSCDPIAPAEPEEEVKIADLNFNNSPRHSELSFYSSKRSEMYFG